MEGGSLTSRKFYAETALHLRELLRRSRTFAVPFAFTGSTLFLWQLISKRILKTYFFYNHFTHIYIYI